jgi:hypothetical protein
MSYCDSIKHWDDAGIDVQLCARNITYLVMTFVPMNAKERAEDALFRRMLWWLGSRAW